jgi:hypothetical protein
MPSVKIAHLSDLYCQKNKKAQMGKGAVSVRNNTPGVARGNPWTEWDVRFDSLQRCLVKMQPQAIVITGNLCEYWDDKHFEHLIARIEQLATAIRENSDPADKGVHRHIFAVPGIREFMGGALERDSPFSRFRRKLLAPDCENLQEQLTAFFVAHGVALYPFDPDTIVGGGDDRDAGASRIEDPTGTFESLTSAYQKAAKAGNISWHRATRIALLHHYPLPISSAVLPPGAVPVGNIENAQEFLRSAVAQDIQLILHGHVRTSGSCRIALPERWRRPIAISSCAPTAGLSEDRWELCKILISEGGSITRERYTASRSSPEFTAANPECVIDYAQRRRHHASNLNLFRPKFVRHISGIRSKTKIVRILEHGAALVSVRYQGIQWNKGTRHADNVAMHEFLRSGIGQMTKIFVGWLTRTGESLSHDRRLPPSTDASCEIEIKGDSRKRPELPGGCEIIYGLVNGYSVTLGEHEETYGTRKFADARDWSTVESEYPVEYLELIVRFPGGEYLPDPRSIALESWKFDERPDESEAIRTGAYPVDTEETDFLQEKGAVRLRREILELSALIRHPQPGRAYTLRWPLQHTSRPPQATIDDWDRWRARFLEMSKPADTAWFARLEQGLRTALEIKAVQMFVYGYDSEAFRMKIVYPPAAASLSEPIPVGRGIVGWAFRTRRPFHHPKDQKKGFDPVDPAECLPAYSEILALPIVHPIGPIDAETAPMDEDADPIDLPANSKIRDQKVSAVFILVLPEPRDGVTDPGEPRRLKKERAAVNELYGRIVASFPGSTSPRTAH